MAKSKTSQYKKKSAGKKTITKKVSRSKPVKRTCSLPKIELRPLPQDANPNRLRLIRQIEKKWVNGTVLKYYFFDEASDGHQGAWVGPQSQREAVRNAFKEWKDLGIGLDFREVSDRREAEVRIGFDQTDGSWSYVGRDIIDFAANPDERTMNFGWDLTTPYGRDTALHEIGHTLGFPHAHQNPFSGIEWNEQAVLDFFSGSPNFWPQDTTRWNVLRKLSANEVEGTNWDPDSIMQYWFPAGLIASPTQYQNGLEPQPGLSDTDIQAVKAFYPPLPNSQYRELKAFESQRLLIEPGEQKNFYIRPDYSREYNIQTFGQSDTVIILFEIIDGEPRFVTGDDDSGFARNALLRARLHRNREYILRVRLYHSQLSGQSAVMMY